METAEQLREKGNMLAEIVRGYTGQNALVLLTQAQIQWLANMLGGYPAGASPSGDIYAELNRASLEPLPELTHLRSPHEAVADWEAVAQPTPAPLAPEREEAW
jgi:hypothetical protein